MANNAEYVPEVLLTATPLHLAHPVGTEAIANNITAPVGIMLLLPVITMFPPTDRFPVITVFPVMFAVPPTIIFPPIVVDAPARFVIPFTVNVCPLESPTAIPNPETPFILVVLIGEPLLLFKISPTEALRRAAAEPS